MDLEVVGSSCYHQIKWIGLRSFIGLAVGGGIVIEVLSVYARFVVIFVIDVVRAYHGCSSCGSLMQSTKMDLQL